MSSWWVSLFREATKTAWVLLEDPHLLFRFRLCRTLFSSSLSSSRNVKTQSCYHWIRELVIGRLQWRGERERERVDHYMTLYIRGSAIAKVIGENVQKHSDTFEELVRVWVFQEQVDGRNLTDIMNEQHENTKYVPSRTKLKHQGLPIFLLTKNWSDIFQGLNCQQIWKQYQM